MNGKVARNKLMMFVLSGLESESSYKVASKNGFVIASVAKQSLYKACNVLDCFGRSSLAMTVFLNF